MRVWFLACVACLSVAVSAQSPDIRTLALKNVVRIEAKTPDGKIELHRTHECFGSCNKAPMCRLNDEYRENLTPEATQALIAELKSARGTNGRAVPPPTGA